jgi:hypothetical protein
VQFRSYTPGSHAQAHLEYGAVTWPGEIDLAPDAMYAEIKEAGTWVLQWRCERVMAVLTPTGVKHDAPGQLVLVDHPPDAHADLIEILYDESRALRISLALRERWPG